MEAGEPEERAAEENEVEEKDGERKAEKMGSEASESSAEDVGVAALAVEGGFLKVESRWIGEALAETGDLAAAGDAIVIFDSLGYLVSLVSTLSFVYVTSSLCVFLIDNFFPLFCLIIFF